MVKPERIGQLRDEHGTVAVVTVVRTAGSSPRDIGAKMVVFPDGRSEGTIGGGKLEKLAIRDALAQLKKGGHAYKQYKLRPEKEKGIGVECGGDVDIFIEVVGQPDSLVILGAGHIGLALYRLASVLDFKVTIIDDRPEYAVPGKFKMADVRLMEYGDPSILRLIGKNSYVVVVTHAHMNDATALKSVLKSKSKYIGMIGSRRKVAKVREQLIAEGVNKSRLDEVFTPVGLDIGAESPAEIAVSILSEIIHVKRSGKPSKIGMGRRK
jgi:xanthine dehydrogenase accessory factor